MEYRSANDPLRSNSSQDYYTKSFFSSRKVTHLGWMCLACEILAIIIQFAVFIAPGWAWTIEGGSNSIQGEMYGYYGLWFICRAGLQFNYGLICTVVADFSPVPAFYHVCQGLTGLGLVLGVIALIIISLYTCRKKNNRKPFVIGIFVPLTVFIVLIEVAAVIVFATFFLRGDWQADRKDGYRYYERNLNYSWGLTLVASFFHGLASALAFKCSLVYWVPFVSVFASWFAASFK